VSIEFLLALRPFRIAGNKKADAVAHPEVHIRVGLLFSGPPAALGGLPFI
jgi:hypothetical protein